MHASYDFLQKIVLRPQKLMGHIPGNPDPQCMPRGIRTPGHLLTPNSDWM